MQLPEHGSADQDAFAHVVAELVEILGQVEQDGRRARVAIANGRREVRRLEEQIRGLVLNEHPTEEIIMNQSNCNRTMELGVLTNTPRQ